MRFITYDIDDQEILDFMKERDTLSGQLKLLKFKLDLIDQQFKRTIITRYGHSNFFVSNTTNSITSTVED